MDDLISRKDLMKKIAHHTVYDSMSYVTSERSSVYEWVKGDMFGLVKDAPAVASMPRWISVEEKAPVFPCVVYDGHNPPYTPQCIVTLKEHDGENQWIPDVPLEAVLEGKLPKFCRLPVTHWMPLPQPTKEMTP